MKEVQKSTAVSLMKTSSDEISLVEQSTTATTTTVIGKSSINNCIISMNSNGQYQIKPRIMMKEPTKTTISPIIFPTTSATNSSSIQSENLNFKIQRKNSNYYFSFRTLFASADDNDLDSWRWQEDHNQNGSVAGNSHDFYRSKAPLAGTKCN